MATKRVHVRSATYDIPVDKDGYVPETALRKRFADRSAGVSRGKRSRDPVQDYDEHADVVLPEKLTPEQAAAWWHRPAEYDIECIDTPGPVKTRKGIRFHGTDMEVEKMGQMIEATHSPAEVKKIAEERTVYTARPLKTGVKGLYRPGENGIELDRRYGMEHQTVAHETTHMMRDRDKSRKDILIKRNEAMNVEESCTVAEQMARSRKKDVNGYYWEVPVFDEGKRRWRKPTDVEAIRMCEEDYMLFTYGRGKPLKEKEAKQSVERNWADSHISRLRYQSRSMAIASLAEQDPSFNGKLQEMRSSVKKNKPKKNAPKKNEIAMANILFRKRRDGKKR